MAKQTIKVRQKKGMVTSTERQQATVRGLGLRRIGHTKELKNTSAVRGMIKKVLHLVEVVE
jgi:large subunit ribosomal protein L30